MNPARSTVRHRSGKDYRKHSPRHQPPAVRVRRHWRTALQGRIIGPQYTDTAPKKLSSEPLVVYTRVAYNVLSIDTLSPALPSTLAFMLHLLKKSQP